MSLPAIKEHLTGPDSRSLISYFTHQRMRKDVKFSLERNFALTIIADKPKLQQCTPVSVGQCILDVGALGLSLSPTKKEAYLVPYKVKGIGTVCTLSISYMGMEQIAYRSGRVTNIQTAIVREGDKFGVSVEGNRRIVTHVEDTSRYEDKDRKVTHVYCIATLDTGEHHVEVMDRVQIMGVRDAAARKNDNQIPFTWAKKNPFRYEMYKKAVLRRAWKNWPREAAHDRLTEIIDRTDPIDFGAPAPAKDEEQGEASLTLTDEHILELEQMCDEAGVQPAHHKNWLLGVARALGYREYAQIKVDEFDSAKEKLAAGLDNMKKRKGGTA